ncbi:MAG: CBS domain-containing protein [Candidatus Scalindua sp.]|nr:CBS domain-containing protein [Candidatus Scalindua sp.]
MGLFFIIFGFFNIFTGNFIGGLWLALIGMFIKSAADSSYQQLVSGNLLQGIKISEIMTRDLITVNNSITLDRLVDDYFLKYRYNSYPVVSDDTLLGIVSINNVKQIPREEWKEVNVSKILDARIIGFCVHPDDDATLAMSKMIKNGLGRVPVIDSGKLTGIVSNKDIMQILRHKIDLNV